MDISTHSNVVVGVRRDRNRVQEAEDELGRLDRQHAMISGITALGIRVQNREDLFSNACRIAVELGEFEMAWIALVHHKETKIVLMGWAGLDDEAMAAIKGCAPSRCCR